MLAIAAYRSNKRTNMLAIVRERAEEVLLFASVAAMQ